LYIYESDYEQYRLGLMNEDIWESKKKGLEILLNACVASDIYEFRYPAFSGEFRAVADSLSNSCGE